MFSGQTLKNNTKKKNTNLKIQNEAGIHYNIADNDNISKATWCDLYVQLRDILTLHSQNC